MVDDGSFAENFVRAIIRREYDGRWDDYRRGVRVWDEGVGIFIYFGGDLSVRFYVGVASGLVLSSELCAQLAVINQENPMGTFYLSNEWAHDEFPAEWLVDDQEGQDSNIRDRLHALRNGTWILLYHVKVWKRWIEPTGVSEQIILDVLANI